MKVQMHLILVTLGAMVLGASCSNVDENGSENMTNQLSKADTPVSGNASKGLAELVSDLDQAAALQEPNPSSWGGKGFKYVTNEESLYEIHSRKCEALTCKVINKWQAIMWLVDTAKNILPADTALSTYAPAFEEFEKKISTPVGIQLVQCQEEYNWKDASGWGGEYGTLSLFLTTNQPITNNIENANYKYGFFSYSWWSE